MTKTLVITGASRGLGLAIAQRAVQDGYRVIAVARTCPPPLERLLAAQESRGRVAFYEFDLAQVDKIHGLFRSITHEHGHLYGLVNNAALGYDGVLATMHDSQIERLVRVNVLSTVLMSKYASRSMLLHGSGRIVNIASIIALTGFNGLSVYAATKAAIVGLSKSLARELGKARITVNAVAPGYMETDMTSSLSSDKLRSIKRRSPLGKLVVPDDVAGAVSYLLGESASCITGTVMTVDAGATA